MMTPKMSVVVNELFHGSDAPYSVTTMLPLSATALIVSVIVLVSTFQEMFELLPKNPELPAWGAIDELAAISDESREASCMI